jgi:hypothetical protein
LSEEVEPPTSGGAVGADPFNVGTSVGDNVGVEKPKTGVLTEGVMVGTLEVNGVSRGEACGGFRQR